MFEGIDNMVWSGLEKDISHWCVKNKVVDEITETEIEEIWQREVPEEDEPIRLNGKTYWRLRSVSVTSSTRMMTSLSSRHLVNTEQ